MKTVQTFERKMREASYASLDEARSGIKSHPLVGDYLVDLLIERKVLTVRDDGRVIGVTKAEGREDSKAPKSTEWKSTWPPKKKLIALLESEDDENERGPGIPFRKMQEYLKQDGLESGHWLCLHALWRLMEQGIAEKHGGGYRLTDKAQADLAADHIRQRKIITDILRRIGPPYDAKKFVRELTNTPDHDWLEYGSEHYDQSHINGVVQNRIQKGEL
jgi:hypothetical protein